MKALYQYPAKPALRISLWDTLGGVSSIQNRASVIQHLYPLHAILYTSLFSPQDTLRRCSPDIHFLFT